MSANEIRKNDVNTQFTVTVEDGGTAVDISSASTLEMVFKKPSGTKVTQTASLINSGTDGKMKYLTVSDDLNEIGTWELQGHVVIGGGNWLTDIARFKVHRNL